MKTNISKLARPNILAMQPYSSARDESGGIQGIFLDANENPFGENNRYPDPYQNKLKNKLSQIKNIPIEKIFVGNGSDEIIDHIYRIFCNPGKDKAMFFSPTFGMYQVAAELNEVEIIDIPLTSDFQINIEEAKKYFNDENLKVIVICSPNNPTGNNIHPKDINFILENFKGIIAIDEAYIEFTNQNSYLDKLDHYPNLVIFQTLSKAWGIAGVRVGMAYSNPEVIQLLNKVKHPYNISVLNQKAAIKALSQKEEFEKRRKIIFSEKEKIRKELEKLSIVTKIYPSDTNFFLVEFKEANLIFHELLNQKIIVRNQTTKIHNSIRITVGSPEENEKLITVLKKLN
ncbi:histidinol-phosphate transaminase [Apibacter adventoris]|uniref:Histidinol-phosphate aminotransferase n=1 Tax=Apibacter adventoris TaxID=1679466 RepID=A0A2S8AGD0_9FLAO|nr:histidinol-phosphate transaminase [Apibacter adventoris]PQL95434.1 histidinol-phosphate transaminase [Apibacter adventoris]